MVDQLPPHDAISWLKQRLDELDVVITEIEKSAKTLTENARKEAEQASARLRESRSRLEKQYEGLQVRAEALKQSAADAQKSLEAEWVEIESAFQSFLSAAKDAQQTARDVVAARARAQRQSWEASLNDLRHQASDAAEKARGEFDGVLKQLSARIEQVQNSIGEAKGAGDESWKALKSSLAEVREVHDRTMRKVKEAFSKLR